MSEKRMTVEEYEKYFEQFDPTDYNPREWARLAKKAGMKYACLLYTSENGRKIVGEPLTEEAIESKEFEEAFKQVANMDQKNGSSNASSNADEMCIRDRYQRRRSCRSIQDGRNRKKIRSSYEEKQY